MLLSNGNDSDFQAAGLIAETSACIQGNCRRKEALSYAPPSHATAMMVREPHNPYTRHVRTGFEVYKTKALGLWHSGQCPATCFHDGLALQ